MTFGPVTVNRPGAGATVGIMGPIGTTGAPGKDGAPGPQGPAVFLPIVPWVSGTTYSPGTATRAASYVSINGGSYACTAVHTSGVFLTDLAAGLWQAVATQGATGAAGTPGSTWYTGTAAPTNAVGINGDYFLRSDTNDVLLKVSGGWTKIANLTGPKGLDGNGAGTVVNNGGATVGDVALFDTADGTRIRSGGRLGFVIVDTPSSPYTSVNRDEVWWNTASAAAVQLLPASPAAGNRVKAVRSGANTVTVQQNGNTIAGVAADLVIDQDKTGVELVWDATLTTWLVALIQHA